MLLLMLFAAVAMQTKCNLVLVGSLVLLFVWPIFNASIGFRHIIPYLLPFSIVVAPGVANIFFRLERGFGSRKVYNCTVFAYILTISISCFAICQERLHKSNRSYSPIIEFISKQLPPKAVLVTTDPQLLYLTTGHKSFGGSQLTHLYRDMLSTFGNEDSHVIFSNARSDLEPGYDFYLSHKQEILREMRVVTDNPDQNFAVLAPIGRPTVNQLP